MKLSKALLNGLIAGLIFYQTCSLYLVKFDLFSLVHAAITTLLLDSQNEEEGLTIPDFSEIDGEGKETESSEGETNDKEDKKALNQIQFDFELAGRLLQKKGFFHLDDFFGLVSYEVIVPPPDLIT